MRTDRRSALRAPRVSPHAADPLAEEDPGIPGWVEVLVAVPLHAAGGFALAAVPVAMAGMFEPLVVLAAALAAFAGLSALWWVRSVGSPLVRFGGRLRGATVGAVVLIAGVTAVNLVHSAEHVLTNRDPGGYVTTAEWLADSGDLLVDAKVGPFAGRDDLFFPAGAYYDGRDDGALYPQFVHLLPTALAALSWLGGATLLTGGNAILGGLALLAFYAFASRLLRPWLAFVATATLAVNLLQLHFTRDAYSEILTQLFLFGGLWALWHARSELDPGRGFVAGLLLGATAMTRVDAFLLTVPVAAYLMIGVARSVDWADVPRLRYRLFLLAAGLGTATTASIALADGLLFSPIYLRHLGEELWAIAALLALTVAVGAAAVADHDRLHRWGAWVVRRRRLIGGVLLLGILAAALYAGAIRPYVERAMFEEPNGLVAEVQERTGLPVEPRRSYAELSLQWLSWYLGPLTLAAAIITWAVAVRDAVVLRHERTLPFVLAFTLMTALYLWKPNITPDHFWAMRRMLSVTVPGLVVFTFVAVQWLLDRPPGVPGWLARIAGIVLAASTLGVQAAITAPWVDVRNYDDLLPPTEEICDAIGDDAAVVLQPDVGLHWMQTVRGFCDVPAAQATERLRPDEYVQLAGEWEENGRRLVILSSDPTPVPDAGWTSRRVATVEIVRAERTLTRRPSSLESRQLDFYLTRVPAG